MIGCELGSALFTRGSLASAGMLRRMALTRRSTSSAAWVGSVPSTSCTKTFELPSLEVEVMLETPDMPETAFSIGWVMRSSTSWAVAPV